MNNNQFNDYLIRLATIADVLRGLLKREVNDLDAELITEHGDDIDAILFDLDNVKTDCEFLSRIMRMGKYID